MPRKINGIEIHHTLTDERLMEAPDARNIECESCGAEQVFGAAELAMEFVA